MLNLIGYLTAIFTDVKEREEGQTLVEYALILALIAVVCIGALTLLGGNVRDILSEIAGAIGDAGGS